MISFLKPASRGAIALAAICAPAQASAGEMGPSSRGTITISLSIAPRMDVRTMSVSELAGTEAKPLARSQAICISANTPTRAYGVSLLTSSAWNGPGQGSSGRYFVEWIDEAGKFAGARIQPGSTVTGFVAQEGGCTARSSPSARLVIRPLPETAAGVEGSPAAATLLIIPE